MASLERKVNDVAAFVIGMDKQDAEDFITREGLRSRVVDNKNESPITASDYIPNRITLQIKNNQVKETKIG